jgi:hypothetical protein
MQDPVSALLRMNRFPRTAVDMAASVSAHGGMYKKQYTRGMPEYIGVGILSGLGKGRIICWDNRRAPKRRSMAGDSENTLRECRWVSCLLRSAQLFHALGGIIAIGEDPRLR